MQFLEKHFTKKNLFYITLLSGILATFTILALIQTFLKTNTIENINDIKSLITAVSSIYNITYIYEICLVLNIIIIAISAFLYFHKQYKSKVFLIVFITSTTALIFQFISIGFILEVQKIVKIAKSGNMYDFMNINLTNFEKTETKLVLSGMAMLANMIGTIYFVYLKFIKKDNLDDISTSDAKLNINFTDISDELIKAKVSMIGKTKTLLSTTKRKIIVLSCAVILFIIIGFSIFHANKKTDFNVTRNCEIIIEGDSGNASAYMANCDIDYDINNPELANFVQNITYEFKNNGTFKNGDTVKAVAKYSQETANALKLNIVNTSLSKKVQGLTEYYNFKEEIPNEILEDANTQILALVDSIDFVDELNFNTLSSKKEISFKSSDTLKKYFVTEDTNSFSTRNDSIVYLFKLTFSGEKSTSFFSDTYEAAEETIYLYVKYDNVNSKVLENTDTSYNTLNSYSTKTDDDAIKELMNKFYNSYFEEFQ